MMWLAINKKSGHYQYYDKLNYLWGRKTRNNISLCKYSWELLLFSFISLVCLPVIAIGWLLLKGLRLIYQLMGKFSVCQKMFDYIDSLGFGEFIEEMTENMNSHPFLSCSIIGVLGSMIIYMICMFFIIVFFGLSFVVSNLLDIPSFILNLILYAGWVFMWLFIVVGFLMYVILESLKIALNFIYPYAYICLSFVVKNIPLLIVVAGFSFLIVYGLIKFFETKIGKRIIKFLSLKFNGFQKAREEAIARRTEEDIAIRKKRIYEHKETLCEKRERDYFILFKKFYSGTKEFLFTGKEKEYNNRKFLVLGFFPLVWKTLLSIKEGICPFIEFIDDEEELEKN